MVFCVIPKITSATLCKPIHDKSEKWGNEAKKLQKFEYLENENSFLDEMKRIFYCFC